MKCKNCGAEITDDSVFCEHCGNKIGRRKRFPIWVILLIILGTILLTVIFCGLLRAFNSNQIIEDTWHEDSTIIWEDEIVSDEILSKAREAGQAKCNCYKNDPVAIESCFRPILEENFAAYKDDANFQAEMDAEYKRCIRGE